MEQTIFNIHQNEHFPFFTKEGHEGGIALWVGDVNNIVYVKASDLEPWYKPSLAADFDEDVIWGDSEVLLPVGGLQRLVVKISNHLPPNHFSAAYNWGMDFIKPKEKAAMKTYFLLAPKAGMVKIGRGVDVSARMKTVQTGSPEILQLLGVLNENVEHLLHKRFAHLRSHGEWFQYPGELQDFITKCLKSQEEHLKMVVA